MELGHAEVGGPAALVIEIGAGPCSFAAAVVEGVAVVGHGLVVGEDRPALAGVNILAHLEAEAAGGAPASQAAAPPLAENRLAGVFDHRHVVLLGMARMVSRSAAEPPICTGMIAAVRSVIAASSLAGSIWNVSRSESTKTGMA